MDDVINQVERPREDAPLSTQTCPYLDNRLTSHDIHAVWTKRRPQDLSMASQGAPVVASSTVGGGGGCEGYFQIPIAFFLGG